MKIQLVALNEPLLLKAFQNIEDELDGDNIEAIDGDILLVETDALVSPANSFGFMDGGIDMAYSLFYGWDVQHVLQEIIRENHEGELFVGQAAIVALPDVGTATNLISAPTMRVPTVLPKDTINPYLATRAALRLAVQSKMDSIAFPGMGTGCGRVSAKVAERQMLQAIIDVRSNVRFPVTLQRAIESHINLIGD